MNYTIGETYTLPSKGKIYDPPIDPEVKLRSLTTLEEMKRLSKSDRPYQNMSEIIDDCLVKGPELSSYDMAIGDYQFLLHKLRIVTYGPEYELGSTCPTCATLNTGVIDLDQLNVTEYTEEFEQLKEVTLPRCKAQVKLKVQTPRILDNIAVLAKAKKSKGPSSSAYMLTLQNVIDEINGKQVDALTKEDFVSKLEMMDANILLQTASKLNNSIGLDTNLITDCENCGLTYTNTFRITSEFFGPRIYT